MEYWFLIFIIIFLSSVSAMFSSALKHLNSEELEERFPESKRGRKISKLKSKYEEYPDLFSPLEMLGYVTACIISPILLLDFSNPDKGQFWLNTVYIILFNFIIILIFRNLFSAIGSRLRLNLLLPTAGITSFFYYLNKPMLFVLRKMKAAITNKNQEDISRVELNALVESAHEEGSIDQGEYKILKNIMNFGDVIVSDVMTPRTVIFSLEANKTVEEVIAIPELQMYSRIPLWAGESVDDTVLGYVMTKDILLARIKGLNKLQLKELAREIYIIPENAELDIALDKFLKSRQHIFMVVDEFGGIEGLLTMEDVLETILGSEIVDEADKVVDLRELAKHRRDKRIASSASKN